MPDSPNKLIIISFPFLLNKDFSPKYHLFDSLLLSRIVSISTEQDLFLLTGILALSIVQSIEIKEKSQSGSSIYDIFIPKKKR